MNNNNNIVKTMVICFEHYRFSFTAMAGCYIQHLWPELWQVINETVTRSLIWGFSETISKYSRQFYLESRLRWKKISKMFRNELDRCLKHRWTRGPSKSKATRTLPWWHHWKKGTHTHACVLILTLTHTHTHTHSHTHTFTHSNAHSMTYSRVGPKPSQFAGIGVVATKQADK